MHGVIPIFPAFSIYYWKSGAMSIQKTYGDKYVMLCEKKKEHTKLYLWTSQVTAQHNQLHKAPVPAEAASRPCDMLPNCLRMFLPLMDSLNIIILDLKCYMLTTEFYLWKPIFRT